MAVSAAALLSGSALSVVATSVNSASAACAPSTVVAPHATAKKKVKVSTRTTVQKVGRRYVATVRITARQGSASVTLAQSVCPDGAAGAAASTTQSGAGVGVVTKSASAKASSKAAAKRAAKAKAAAKIARIRRAGATKRGLAAAKRRATAAAQAVAADKARHALYDARITYFILAPSGTKDFVESSTPAPGNVALSAVNGDLVATIPASSGSPQSVACIRRAPAWPTNFVFDAASVTSPSATAYAQSSGNDQAVLSFAFTGVSTGDNDQVDTSPWLFAAVFQADGTQFSGVDSSGTGFAGEVVCIEPEFDSAPALTVTFHGPRVGRTLSAPDSNGLSHVTDGMPITIG